MASLSQQRHPCKLPSPPIAQVHAAVSSDRSPRIPTALDEQLQRRCYPTGSRQSPLRLASGFPDGRPSTAISTVGAKGTGELPEQLQRTPVSCRFPTPAAISPASIPRYSTFRTRTPSANSIVNPVEVRLHPLLPEHPTTNTQGFANLLHCQAGGNESFLAARRAMSSPVLLSAPPQSLEPRSSTGPAPRCLRAHPEIRSRPRSRRPTTMRSSTICSGSRVRTR